MATSTLDSGGASPDWVLYPQSGHGSRVVVGVATSLTSLRYDKKRTFYMVRSFQNNMPLDETHEAHVRDFVCQTLPTKPTWSISKTAVAGL